MSNVRRIYVEKRPEYAVRADELTNEFRAYLSLKDVSVRELVRYDVENLSDEVFEEAIVTVFSEPPVDIVYREGFPHEADEFVFSMEYLPGQFDQRADSAEQCVRLLDASSQPIIRSGITYAVKGTLTEEDKKTIEAYVINPVEARVSAGDKPDTLVADYPEPADVSIFDGFCSMSEEDFKALYDSLGLAMTYKDFLHIRNYFSTEEKRDPSMTEIRVLDTYWSDHCRHTTFATELTDVKFDEGKYKAAIEGTFKKYLEDAAEINAGRDDKFTCLMDIALMGMKKLRKDGKLDDLDESDEINACTIVVPLQIRNEDGEIVTEDWLISFKNETHNHPTEIEPFGGAATCLGGAIRDPLSGRTYVYQAMRVTGAADPTKSLKETLANKLPQRKIVTTAAKGYSSYGNQIGLATGLVQEVYHPNYVAKRMEIGAVIGAAPKDNVKRMTSDPGDIIVLLGGRTGRDGCGGATGSSKAHNSESLESCGAEVQKGNPPTERKLQRLFRRPEVTTLIKKCNDFGAGGVSVAIGELADGLDINLDLVPKKYAGLDGTELAISESQERMALVVDPKDADKILDYAREENLEAVKVATVTESPRLVMKWRGKEIVNISRAFLNTNGAHQETTAEVEMPSEEVKPFAGIDEEGSTEEYSYKNADGSLKDEKADVKTKWLDILSDLNVASERGLVEMFDSTIGANTVTMPYGGKYQLSPMQTMIATVPMLGTRRTTSVSMMSYGLDPYLMSWSPYHGAVYSVLDSVAKIAAAGGDVSKIRLTFQEYFERMTEDPKRWGKPLSALLGAYSAQIGLGLPSIGGKDSMSGSFNDIDVPPTLCSFAVCMNTVANVVTTDLKEVGNLLLKLDIKKDENDLPVFSDVLEKYALIRKAVTEGKIQSAFAVGFGGIIEAVSKMAFGNKFGVELDKNVVSKEELGRKDYGSIIMEVRPDDVKSLGIPAKVIGTISEKSRFKYGSARVTMEEAIDAWTSRLKKVFPVDTGVLERFEGHVKDYEKAAKEGTPESELKFRYNPSLTGYEGGVYQAKNIMVAKNKIAKPHVFIPVFPGTNCEYDSARAFERAGAEAEVIVLNNMDEQGIRDSVDAFTKAIRQSQIVMFPGGFSGGDEPDGSGKFIATTFRNEKIKEEMMKLLNERDGLVLGICNGFQALIKLGLVPMGEIVEQTELSPTLARNSIGRHQSRIAYTKVVSNKSPWLRKAVLGGVYSIPISHGEGRFVAKDEWLRRLFENGQVATQYVDADGNVTMDEDYNINGSYMAIEGITSPDGRVLGKMGHSERRDRNTYLNISGEKNQKIFESGVEYFK
ncbi:MAG: phosphoribosylformylglycinamidine synthase [Eubacterium sp.]|nr:phosphoribosylformylglycinamidine synthase [Eubacterium sp.]